MDLPSKQILYFDGYCGLCNGYVDFILKNQKRENKIYFTPLQSVFAQRTLPAEILTHIKGTHYQTLVFQSGDLFLIKSEAILKIFENLGGVWKIMLLFKILPKDFRNFCYDFVANHRYSWFGKKNSCRLPTEKEKEFFIESAENP